jgi:hypothetical protein
MKEQKTKITFKCSTETLSKIRKYCKEEGMFINRFFEIAVLNELKRRGIEC